MHHLTYAAARDRAGLAVTLPYRLTPTDIATAPIGREAPASAIAANVTLPLDERTAFAFAWQQ